ncbi:amidohydrolase family protein [Litoribacter populi]|uniref:amidohydrolase family protein n=1 Tax=Litoribacter populi TaxID=2598460 RepID=UPI00117D8918|nr:amidohydrolase family protein [Litoribacter populi]
MRLLVVVLFMLTNTLSAQTYLIKDVNIITFDIENHVLENQTIFVKDGIIQSIGSNLEVAADSVFEGGGKYILPGLAEMHSHIPIATNGDFTYLEDIMWLYLANGVTTVRGMIGHPSHLELREKIKKGSIIGPKIFAAGPSLNGNSVKSSEHAKQLVEEQAEAGYDHLKLHPGLNMDKFLAIAETAKERDIKMGGHVSLDVGLENSILHGYRSIEHMDGYLEAMLPNEDFKDSDKAGPFSMKLTPEADLNKLQELVSLTKNHEVAVAPTMTLFEHFFGYIPATELKDRPEMKYLPKDQIEKWEEQKLKLEADGVLDESIVKPYLELREKILMALYDADVLILLSSDSPQVFNVPGFSTHHELASMQKAGMKPIDILKSGSKNVATYFNVETFGEIKEGMAADFLMVSDNPLDNLSVLKELDGIFLNGQYFDSAKIKTELKRIEDKNK